MKGGRKRPAQHDMNILGNEFDQLLLAETAPSKLSSLLVALKLFVTLSPPSARPAKRSRFMDMPAEMRNAIYAELYRIAVSPTQEVNIREVKELAPQPALTMTCRQIREESLEYMREAHKSFWNSRIFFFTMKYFEHSNKSYLASTKKWCKTLELGPVRHFQLRLHNSTHHVTTLQFDHHLNDLDPDRIRHFLLRQIATLQYLNKILEDLQRDSPIAEVQLKVGGRIWPYLRSLGASAIRARSRTGFW
ncbi:hypothetical protein LTR10_000299 [Elasticomyces elasticus]|nr:hypothetical protein LTR10_000299 [Elasticomyces elasticus]KAK4980445.1 hypothetical protein LTR42_000752 [Elasticomyces elasticus]